jgi:predicted GIY-YIG superfamily endonuclease
MGGEYTSQRLPVKLVYSQEFPDYQQAFIRERQVKGWSRTKKECLIRGDFDKLVTLSKSHSTKGDDGSTSSP